MGKIIQFPSRNEETKDVYKENLRTKVEEYVAATQEIKRLEKEVEIELQYHSYYEDTMNFEQYKKSLWDIQKKEYRVIELKQKFNLLD